MATFRKKIIALSVAVSIAAMPTAHAGLQEALNEMFVGNVTTPGVYESQTRGGFVGGSGTFRAPGRSFNLLSFDPPRLDAGCGGIDFFGGSFSFINADQLVALFRQIAANAIGVAFKRAINAISPDLGKLMDDFQNKLQELNSMMRNTCAIANQIVKKVTDPGPATEQVQESTRKTASADGTIGDMFQGFMDFFSKPGKNAKAKMDEGKCTDCGNVVWKALTDNEAERLFGAADTDQVGAREIIMSLIGTEVVAPGATENDPPEGRLFGHTLGLAQFRKGVQAGAASFQVLRCNGSNGRNGCLAPVATDFAFNGAEGYVRSMLYGTQTATTSQSGSIIDKIKNCTSGSDASVCGFTSAQKEFMAMSPSPVLALLRSLQHTPAAMDTLTAGIIGPIADQVTVAYGQAAISAARQAASNVKVRQPSFFIERIGTLEAELISLREQAQEAFDRIMRQNEYAAAIGKSNPALWVGVQGRRSAAK